MTKFVISGYGKMGHMVEEELLSRGLTDIVTSEDICSVDPQYAKDAVCIDFTTPAAFRANFRWIAKHFRAAVVGTTGWEDISEEVFAAFERGGCTLIWGSNFSIGVIATFAAIARASQVLRDKGYSPSIEEVHHIHKLDAPSGTAKSMAALIQECLGEDAPISSVREGEVPGTHTLELVSDVDRITIRHEAFSRKGFAKGAVEAALMTEGLSGIHEFKSLII